MAEQLTKPEFNRRGFLQAAAAATVAAATTGTAAALLTSQSRTRPITVPSPAESLPMPKVTSPSPAFVTLRSQMAAVQAENVRLQTRLAASQSQLELVRGAGNQQNGAELEAWRIQLDDAHTQVASLGGQVSLLAGLVQLYEQLDEIDLNTVASDGIATVSSILSGVIEEVPAVAEGIQAGRDALDDFEEQIPSLEEGQNWLLNQMEVLDGFYLTIETALQNTVGVTGTFLEKLNLWFKDILKWLPFGIGDRATAIMDALADLLEQVPETIDGVQTEVVGPLTLWLEKDGDDTQLHRQLIRPVRENALDKASTTVAQVQALDAVYQSRLADPVIEAAEQQQLIRDQIVSYRQVNLI